jgi:hypothetical protein
MKRVCTIIAVAALCVATIRADVSVTQTITMAGAMGGSQPTITTKIKGNKSRFDMSAGPVNMSSIVDLDAKQVIMLNAADKTAQIINATATAGATPNVPASAIDVEYKATGNKRTIAGVACEDHTFSMAIDMSQVGGAQVPPETAKVMEGVKMIASGVTCIAREGKGVAEYVAFQKNAAKSGIAAMGGPAGGGMDKLMAAATSAPGLPYLTEINMTFEGTGPMVDMMKQMGGMKMVQTTTAVSTDALSADLFKAPADYKVTEKK